MKMRTFIRLKPPSKSVKGTFHARYISERERDPGREEPESRPLFTRDHDGLKRTAADRYLAGGERPNARSNEIQHLIIAFNSHDARELQKLEIRPPKTAAPKSKSPTIEHSDESPNLEHSPEVDKKQARREELAAAHRAQIARDRPYADAIRQMMRNLEEQAGLSDLRYVMAVHRHTNKTHVHLLLRRECTDSRTGEKRMLHRLPEEFLNGRDEQGKAKAGLLDRALSDALDTMIPRRQRPARTSIDTPSSRAAYHTDEHSGHLEPGDLDHLGAERHLARPPVRDETKPQAKPEKSGPRFVTPRTALNHAGQNGTDGRDRPPVSAAPAEVSRPTPHEPKPQAAPADAGRPPQPAAERTPNLQLSDINLHPNLQLLEIQSPQTTPRENAHEEALKKIVAARFAENPPPGTPEALHQARTPTKTQLTDSPAETSKTVEQKKSSPTRGR